MKVIKKLMKQIITFLVILTFCTPTLDASAGIFDYGSIKGLQGATDNFFYGGINHTLLNVCLDEIIKDPNSRWATNGWIAPYEFEGEKFYFQPTPSGWSTVTNANNKGMSVSVVFLIRKKVDAYGSDSSFLIDAGSRVDGYNYYAPNTDMSTYGGRALRAYWHFLMEKMEANGQHIDNFILGNEVNMPNHWHYSGSTDPTVCATKYADAFYTMYSTVKQYNPASRCSISVDHSWQHNDEGRGIAVKTYLHSFHNRISQHSANVDWCISTHLYPAQLFDTELWVDRHYLSPSNTGARFVDGSNLWVMTTYVKDNFGSQHRIMLTEQGFCDQYGANAQAASLAYSYYAAKYDPMVDSFLLHTRNEGKVSTPEGIKSLNFDISGTLAEEVYTKIDNGNAADQKWIADVCLPTIGVTSWADIIPNFGAASEEPATAQEIAAVKAFVERMYTVALGRNAEAAGLEDWSTRLLTRAANGSGIATGFIMSEEFFSKNYSDEEYVTVLYRTFLDREPDPTGLASWTQQLENNASREHVLTGFVNSIEFDAICIESGIDRGDLTSDLEIIPEGLYDFIKRTYLYALEREGEEQGINYWVQKIAADITTPEIAAKSFFLSAEYTQKNTSDDVFIQSLYQTFMDRDADEGGFAYWQQKLQAGESRESVLEGFSKSTEFDNIMASFGL